MDEAREFAEDYGDLERALNEEAIKRVLEYEATDRSVWL